MAPQQETDRITNSAAPAAFPPGPTPHQTVPGKSTAFPSAFPTARSALHRLATPVFSFAHRQLVRNVIRKTIHRNNQKKKRKTSLLLPFLLRRRLLLVLSAIRVPAMRPTRNVAEKSGSVRLTFLITPCASEIKAYTKQPEFLSKQGHSPLATKD